MCGIAGLIARTPINLEAIQTMITIQAHRGPDGEGIWFTPDKQVVLGHRRLSIIDLSERARQPMADVSGRYVITFNGEIYNYIEIKDELKHLGASFKSDSDTEVIIEAYKQWGTKCLDQFNGMFAFALYDSMTDKLFCARDRYGEKPFLFVSQQDFFIFASEYKALLQIADVPLDVDEFRLALNCDSPGGGLDRDNTTVFPTIRQLLPSEALFLDIRTLQYRIWRYWDISPQLEVMRLPEEEAFCHFRELLVDSVRLRLRSDVPVGSCLSGGLDSSAIVYIIRKQLKQKGKYHCFTGSFPGTVQDEWKYAQEVVQETQIVPHITEPSAEQFSKDLPDFIWYNELPVGSSSQYAQWCVFRLARENDVTVLLDGQGGDELLGGYEQYFQYYVNALEDSDRERLARELPEIRKRYPLALSSPIRTLRDWLPFRFRHWLSNQFSIGTNLLYGLRPDVARIVKHCNDPKMDQRFNPLSSILYQDCFSHSLTTLLRYGDRNSMAHSREVRLPFCDHRLAEFVFTLPPWYLMGEVQTKRVLRESMREIISETIRTRWNKQGFLPPQELWFKNGLLKEIEEVFHNRSFEENSLWEAKWWQRALKRLRNGETHLAWIIWHPFIMEMWRQHFVNRLKSEIRVKIFS